VQSGELASERWNVLHGVESVLRSVLLLLDDPEINSPANVDASVAYRDSRDEYNRRARATVEKSKADVPPGLHMPTSEDLVPPPVKTVEDDPDFWNMSDVDDDDDDFGGSDSDMDDFEDYDDDDDDERNDKDFKDDVSKR
jgi:ubiquitin-conjugating enzyme E2 R